MFSLLIDHSDIQHGHRDWTSAQSAMEMVEGGDTNQNETIDQLILYFLPTVITVPPLGLPSNTLVIHILLRKPGICSTSDIFTLNLALINMWFCLLVFAEYIRLLCVRTPEATEFIAWGLNQTGGPLLLCMSAIDSYMAVCHPVVFLRLKDPRLRLSMCLAVSALTVAICCIMKLRSSFKWSIILALLTVSIVIISSCNTLILKSLRKSGPSKKEVHPAKKRAFNLVLSAFLLVNIHYLPPVIEYILRQIDPNNFTPYSRLTGGSYYLLSSGSFIQPLSFLVRTKQLPLMKFCHGSSA